MTEQINLFEKERWAWIPGYENRYKISTLGRVQTYVDPKKTRNKDGIMSLEVTRDKNGELNGHRRVTLKDKYGEQRHWDVSRLVAIVYIPNPECKPVVNHKDNDPSNNCVSNLEWVTHKENTLHAKRSFPRTVSHRGSVVNIANGEIFKSPQDAAKEYDITVRTVLHSCNTKSSMTLLDLRWLEDFPEYDTNLFVEAPIRTRCSTCCSTEGLYASNGAQNKFCGKCGAKLNWLKEPSVHEV